MTSLTNLVHLREHTSKDTTAVMGAGLPKLLQTSKNIADRHLRTRMQNMFDNVDDFLFDLADKAENNKQQTYYFDTMREVRLQKETIMQNFFDEFQRNYRKAAFGEFDFDIGHSADSGLGELRLMEDDTLEESLAVHNMMSKLQSHCREGLSAIAQRMEAVNTGMRYTVDENPLSAAVICAAFQTAITGLGFEVQITLIIYKLFDRFVLSNLGGLFDEVNEQFVLAGILPVIKLKAPVIRHQSTRSVDYLDNEILPDLQIPTGSNAYVTGAMGVPGDVFGSLRQLLVEQRGVGGGMSVGSAVYSGYAGEAGFAGSGMSRIASGVNSAAGNMASGDVGSTPQSWLNGGDVIMGLTGLQQSGMLVSGVQSGIGGGEWLKMQVVEAVGAGGSQAIAAQDADTIDIVCMLFDFILQDTSLPDALRAQVARLQIPIVKLAILDKAFFTKQTHPARQLLNELAYSANGLSGDEADARILFARVETIVDQVLERFADDPSVFEELLLEFREFLDQEAETNRLAGEMLAQIRETVTHEIGQRIKHNPLPAVVRDFLIEPWKEVLHSIGLRDECEGLAWEDALKTADDLIWSIRPKLVVRERQHLVSRIPQILNAIQNGLVMISYGQARIDELFDAIEALHHASLRYQVSTDPVSNLVDASELTAESSDDLMFDLVSPRLKRSEHYQIVRKMALGDWIEMVKDERVVLAKLAWKCDFSGEFTFVDRFYKMVADLPMAELIERFDCGAARIPQELPLFDRAVDALMSGMRQCLSKAKSPALAEH